MRLWQPVNMMPSMRRWPACAALMLILAACGTQAPRPSALTTPSPGALAASPTSSPIAAAANGFTRDTVVRVLQDGLTLRSGPGHAYGEVGAHDVGPGSVELIDTPYLLATGERLLIQDGPLRIEGIDWYSVRAADLPEPDDVIFTEGWVPAREGDAEYLETASASDASCCFSAAGVGSGVTVPVPPPGACSPSACGRAIAWVGGISEPAGTCQIQITQAITGEVIGEKSIRGWSRVVAWWHEQEGAGVVIETDCSWSVHVGPA